MKKKIPSVVKKRISVHNTSANRKEYGFFEKKKKDEQLPTKPKQNYVCVNDSNDKQLNKNCFSK